MCVHAYMHVRVRVRVHENRCHTTEFLGFWLKSKPALRVRGPGQMGGCCARRAEPAEEPPEPRAPYGREALAAAFLDNGWVEEDPVPEPRLRWRVGGQTSNLGPWTPGSPGPPQAKPERDSGNT